MSRKGKRDLRPRKTRRTWAVWLAGVLNAIQILRDLPASPALSRVITYVEGRE